MFVRGPFLHSAFSFPPHTFVREANAVEELAGWIRHPALWGGAMGLLGAGLGGVIGVVLGRPGPRLFACLINATGGLMLAVSCFDLLPDAYALSVPWGLLGLLLGVAAMLAADLLAHRHTYPAHTGAMRRSGTNRSRTA